MIVEAIARVSPVDEEWILTTHSLAGEQILCTVMAVFGSWTVTARTVAALAERIEREYPRR